MAEANEPKKETVRITLPPRRGDAAAPEDDDTVRINIPSRPPTSEPPPTPAPLAPKAGNVPIPRPPVAQNPLPAPRTVLPPPPPAAATPPPLPPVAKTPLPRPSGTTVAGSAPVPVPRPVPATTPLTKETARISVLPDPPKPASARMSKTQPLITATATPVAPPTAPVTIAPAAPQPVLNAIPMPLCWGLVLVSAAILIIEIWNYIS